MTQTYKKIYKGYMRLYHLLWQGNKHNGTTPGTAYIELYSLCYRYNSKEKK